MSFRNSKWHIFNCHFSLLLLLFVNLLQFSHSHNIDIILILFKILVDINGFSYYISIVIIFTSLNWNNGILEKTNIKISICPNSYYCPLMDEYSSVLKKWDEKQQNIFSKERISKYITTEWTRVNSVPSRGKSELSTFWRKSISKVHN